MNKILFLAFLICSVLFSCKEQTKDYPTGVIIDKDIEAVCKKDKSLNQFKKSSFINDSLIGAGDASIGNLITALNMPIFSVDKQDTSLTFLGFMATNGIQIHFNKDSTYAETFVSSKSCLCYKSNLAEKKDGYGASYRPTKQTIVLSQKPKFIKGEKIYGYIKTEGGNLFRTNNTEYDRMRYDYEGYFEVKFESFFGKTE